MWDDKTVDYFTQGISASFGDAKRPACARLAVGPSSVFFQPCDYGSSVASRYLCQIPHRGKQLPVHRSAGSGFTVRGERFRSASRFSSQRTLPDQVTVNATGLGQHTGKWNIVTCPKGHVTHSFLSCDVSTSCWAERDITFSLRPETWALPAPQSCPARLAVTSPPPSFPCDVDKRRVPYSLVCDHRRDCLDDSDETFCKFTPCDWKSQFQCHSKQCVNEAARCDKKQQCVDGSDEHRCPAALIKKRISKRLPVLVEFHSTGGITIRSVQPDFGSVDGVCPETHFWCLDKGYCLPVFVRCNGVYDCPGHEDEKGCDKYMCPGFYRCRASKVCVHVTHVCDDWPLCPQLDDELLCGQSCPLQCTCHGQALFCHQVFAANEHPQLRYLDATGSGMSMHQLEENRMLIHMSLAKCKVKILSSFTFPNLHSLDLSDNLLTEASGHHFRHMPKLTALFLGGNPFTSVFMVRFGPSLDLRKIHTLDCSRVKFPLAFHQLLSVLPNLRSLNLSHSRVDPSQVNRTNPPVPLLRELDLRGCVMGEFPPDLLRGFLHLHLLFADSFKLCCPAVLRAGFDLHHCHAIPDDVSSCDNLLGSVTYRAIVVVLATLSLLGNVVSLVVRVCIGSTWRLSCGGVVLTHLSVADLGTGLYLVILGLADRSLAGHYVWQDDAWRRGAVCHVAGVLALSCRHAATVFITMLFLDRSLQRFPIAAPCPIPAKVKVMCVAVWTFVFLSVAVPLMSQGGYFGQVALCVPLPHTLGDSLDSSYAYGVMVILPMVLHGLCILSEAVSKLSSRKIESKLNRDIRQNGSQFLQLGSLASGLLYTIACLVPTDTHTPRHRASHKSLVYFGCVVSCATNPYLHLYGVRVEHSKRVKEERLFKIVNRAHI